MHGGQSRDVLDRRIIRTAPLILFENDFSKLPISLRYVKNKAYVIPSFMYLKTKLFHTVEQDKIVIFLYCSLRSYAYSLNCCRKIINFMISKHIYKS